MPEDTMAMHSNRRAHPPWRLPRWIPQPSTPRTQCPVVVSVGSCPAALFHVAERDGRRHRVRRVRVCLDREGLESERLDLPPV